MLRQPCSLRYHVFSLGLVPFIFISRAAPLFSLASSRERRLYYSLTPLIHDISEVRWHLAAPPRPSSYLLSTRSPLASHCSSDISAIIDADPHKTHCPFRCGDCSQNRHLLSPAIFVFTSYAKCRPWPDRTKTAVAPMLAPPPTVLASIISIYAASDYIFSCTNRHINTTA